MELAALHHRAVEAWADRLVLVRADQWDDPTPCAGWSVRDLTNHVTGEERWAVPLLDGATIAEVGHRFDGDLLGEDPVATGLRAAADATRAVEAAMLRGGGTVHLSYGEERLDEYVHQLAADHVVHAWDLAVATGGDRRLDPAVVHAVSAWFAGREDAYRSAGVIGPRCAAPAGDEGAGLLAGFGRDPGWGPNHASLARFSAAFGSRDVDAIMALMTEDCVFEATGPAPDGVRHVGATEVRQVWDGLFGGTRDAAFDEEESFVAGDRGVLRWRFDWTEDDGSAGHVRGVDVLRFRDAKVCEKLSYVKG